MTTKVAGAGPILGCPLCDAPTELHIVKPKRAGALERRYVRCTHTWNEKRIKMNRKTGTPYEVLVEVRCKFKTPVEKRQKELRMLEAWNA